MRTRSALIAALALVGSATARAQDIPPSPSPDTSYPGAMQPQVEPGTPDPNGADPYYALPPPDGAIAQPGEPGYVDPNAGCDPNDPNSQYCYEEDVTASEYPVDDGYDATAYVDFQASLAPYGQWVNAPGYGYVWSPSTSIVGAGFVPYTMGGHWVLTEYGWTWVSDWDWGWGPFHYGRWFHYSSYGWCWIPGRVWGPAWVHWRYGGGYVGWAPMGPPSHRGRITIPAPPPANGPSAWRFSTVANLGAPRPQYLTPGAAHLAWQNTEALRNVQTLNRYRVEAGPAPHLVANTTNRAIMPASIHQFAAAAPRATIAPRVDPGRSMMPVRQVPFAPRSAGSSTTIMPRPGPGTVIHGSAATPVFRAPGYAPPAMQAPAWHAPPASAPAYRAPAYTPPAYRAPAYNPPSVSAPAYRAPSYSPPSYSAPAYRAPSYSPPSYSPPAYRAPSYSPPSYSAPAYRAPSYSPPAAPAYRAPSFSAPSFRAPAPAPHFSAPAAAPHFSAPAARSFGGRR